MPGMGATLIFSAWSSAVTAGFPGAGGGPTGMAIELAAFHGPTVVPLTTATSQMYGLPLVRPVTTVVRSSDTPSVDSIGGASPA